VHANMLAAATPRTNGEVINIACGTSVTVNQIIRQINALLGKNVQPRYTETRAGDVKHSLADIARAREVIGYEPLIMFDEGLRLAIDWYRQNL